MPTRIPLREKHNYSPTPYGFFNSEAFGMCFWLDSDGDFRYAPQFKNGQPDLNAVGYVGEWDDFSDVDMFELFKIHEGLIDFKHKVQEEYPDM
tara:strand:+ start:314 stop:592 length:279 start_codon:yes stop_codon:yes gene_type:complete